MPPAATVARSGSLSNHSPARSATAIGIHRRMRYASALPSARNLRPVLSSSNRSPADGSSIDGGGESSTARRTPLMFETLRRNFGYCAASLAENARISSLAFAASRQRTSARPSFVGAQASAAGRMIRSPWRSSPSVRNSAGSIAAVCASVGHVNPGAISPVRAHPPIRSLCSRTIVFSPAFASSVAVTRPFTPPPMTTTSAVAVTTDNHRDTETRRRSPCGGSRARREDATRKREPCSECPRSRFRVAPSRRGWPASQAGPAESTTARL